MTDEQGDNSKLTQEYGEERHLYEAFCREAVRQLDEVLQRDRIALAFPIEQRVKSLDSILEKRANRPGQFKSLNDMRDIAGLRIILLFRRDVDRVTRLIREHFQVTHEEDAQSRLEPDRFGYASVHFEVCPKPEWLSVPSWKPLKGLTAEIQLRTASQHIWAMSSHLLQYKREAHVPVPVRRAINRVAALLELVDLELERVLDERQGYQSAVSQALPRHDRLDVDVLRQALQRSLPPENAAEGDQLVLGELLDECEAFGITTDSALEILLRKHADAIRKADLAAVRKIRLEGDKSGFRTSPERTSRGVFYTHIGLARQALSTEFGAEFTNYLAGKRKLQTPAPQ